MKWLKNTLAIAAIFAASTISAFNPTAKKTQAKQTTPTKAAASTKRTATTRSTRSSTSAKRTPIKTAAPAKTFSYADMIAQIKRMPTKNVISASGYLQPQLVTLVEDNAKRYNLDKKMVKAALEAGLSFHGNIIDKNNPWDALFQNSTDIDLYTLDILQKVNAGKIIPEESTEEPMPAPQPTPAPEAIQKPAPKPEPIPTQKQTITKESERETNIWPQRKSTKIKPEYLKKRINDLLNEDLPKDEIAQKIYVELLATNGAKLLLNITSPRELEGAIKQQIGQEMRNVETERYKQQPKITYAEPAFPSRGQMIIRETPEGTVLEDAPEQLPKRKEELAWYDPVTGLLSENWLQIHMKNIINLPQYKAISGASQQEKFSLIQQVINNFYDTYVKQHAEQWKNIYQEKNPNEPILKTLENRYIILIEQIINYTITHEDELFSPIINPKRESKPEPTPTQRSTTAFERLLQPDAPQKTAPKPEPTATKPATAFERLLQQPDAPAQSQKGTAFSRLLSQ